MSLAAVEVMADGTLVATGVWLGTVASAGPSNVCGDGKTKDASKQHHIATVRNRESEVRGGPWTQRFEKLFIQAGMTLEDPVNTVHLKGHYGPHPEAYHREVYRRLTLALFRCPNTEVCRSRLVAELRHIAEEICTSGSMLNGLITK
jgi:hypothetical protein